MNICAATIIYSINEAKWMCYLPAYGASQSQAPIKIMKSSDNQRNETAKSVTDLNRRKVLKAAGITPSAITFGHFGAEIASARKTQSRVGEAKFVEVGVEHRTTQQSAQIPRSSIVHYDNFLDYIVNPTVDQLILGKFVNQKVKKVFQNNSTVMKTLDYHGLPATAFTGEPDDSLSMSVGGDMSMSQELSLYGEYEAPQIRVTPKQKNKISVSAEGESVTVSPASETTLELSPREVTVERPTESFKEIDDTRRGTTKKRRIYAVETISVVPEVTIRNRGQLDVYETNNGGE